MSVLYNNCLGLLFILVNLTFAQMIHVNREESWTGNWFPYSPDSKEDKNPSTEIRLDLYDPHHGIQMGISDPECDDAEHHLEVDWDFNPINYTCFVSKNNSPYLSKESVPASYTKEYIPESYKANHRCMNRSIEYFRPLPTFGTHRPLWPKYGEYIFLPPQRWIHNLEHGAVVMLYHPCADRNEVNFLRRIVTKCLYRHIITPYNQLSTQHPLALLTWGHRLEISKVDLDQVVAFIKEHALKGPEQTANDGQYQLLLQKHALILNSDITDKELCNI